MTRKGNLRQSDIDAINRYHERTYKNFSIVFRINDDADIIEALNDAHKHNIAGRELIRSWFEDAQKYNATKK